MGERGYLDNILNPVFSQDGTVEYVTGSSRDVTGRKAAEQKLLESEKETAEQLLIFDTALSSLNDSAYIFERDARFRYANKPLLDLLGITLDEIVGKSFSDLNYPDDLAARLQRQIQEVVETKIILRDETAFTSPTGKGGFYEYIFSPVIQPDGSVNFVVGTTRDITQRKRHEAWLTFLADLSQQLIPLSSLKEIIQVFGEKICTFTNASVCAFFEIDSTKSIASCIYEWHCGEGERLIGKYDLREYFTPTFRDLLLAGEPVIVRDVTKDPLVTNIAGLESMQVGAFIDVPLIRNGEWRFVISVIHEEPYDWRDDEIELLVESSNRIWTKVERMRVNDALRESEERLRLIHESIWTTRS